MAVTNKIETAVKRLLVRGKVCWLWDDESPEEQLGVASNMLNQRLTGLILVDDLNHATPTAAHASVSLPALSTIMSVPVTVIGTNIELTNYTGGYSINVRMMEGGTPPANNYNRATLNLAASGKTYVLNNGGPYSKLSFTYEALLSFLPNEVVTLTLDSVDGLAYPNGGGQQIEVVLFDFNQSGPMCSKGQDYHDKDVAAFHVIAKQGEETPPHSGNYLVHVRVECSANADDEAAALALVEERLNQLRAVLDVDDLPAQITAASGGGLTVHPRSVWSRGVGEGVEGRKFSSAWEFVCVACEADL
jgi:hypothetical protein